MKSQWIEKSRPLTTNPILDPAVPCSSSLSSAPLRSARKVCHGLEVGEHGRELGILLERLGVWKRWGRASRRRLFVEAVRAKTPTRSRQLLRRSSGSVLELSLLESWVGHLDLPRELVRIVVHHFPPHVRDRGHSPGEPKKWQLRHSGDTLLPTKMKRIPHERKRRNVSSSNVIHCTLA